MMMRPARLAWLAVLAVFALAVSPASDEEPAREPVRLELRQGGLVANVYRPSIEARYPAVVILGGSGGGISACNEEYAQALARRGMVAMDLAYFGMEGLPSDLERIPLEYLDRGHAQGDARQQAAVRGVLRQDAGGGVSLRFG